MSDNNQQKDAERSSVSARIEGKASSDMIVKFDVFYYVVDEQYAADLLKQEDYRQTRAEDLRGRHMPRTYLKEMTDSIAAGGLSLVSTKSVVQGQWLVMDVEIPKMVQRIRLLGETVPGRHGDGVSRDETAASFRCGLDVAAINRTDLRRAENAAISKSMQDNR